MTCNWPLRLILLGVLTCSPPFQLFNGTGSSENHAKQHRLHNTHVCCAVKNSRQSKRVPGQGMLRNQALTKVSSIIHMMNASWNVHMKPLAMCVLLCLSRMPHHHNCSGWCLIHAAALFLPCRCVTVLGQSLERSNSQSLQTAHMVRCSSTAAHSPSNTTSRSSSPTALT